MERYTGNMANDVLKKKLENMYVDQLKQKLKERKLPTTGLKEDLIQRLIRPKAKCQISKIRGSQLVSKKSIQDRVDITISHQTKTTFKSQKKVGQYGAIKKEEKSKMRQWEEKKPMRRIRLEETRKLYNCRREYLGKAQPMKDKRAKYFKSEKFQYSGEARYKYF